MLSAELVFGVVSQQKLHWPRETRGSSHAPGGPIVGVDDDGIDGQTCQRPPFALTQVSQQKTKSAAETAAVGGCGSPKRGTL